MDKFGDSAKKVNPQGGEQGAEDGKQVLTAEKIKADYDALYGKYSEKSANELADKKAIFGYNPESIETMSDKMKNKIVKEEYGYETFAEATAVLGEKFYIKKDDNDDEEGEEDRRTNARLDQLEKDRKRTEYQAKQEATNNKIELYLARNPNTLDGVENPEQAIKEAMAKLDASMELDERVGHAIILVTAANPKKVKANFATTTAGGVKKVETEGDDGVQSNPALKSIFGNS